MRSRLWLVAALIAGAATPTLGATVACAGTGDRAALVVDTGDNTFTYCVSLTDDSVSGLELIELANDQHGLQYRFGDGGQAVCMLANVGAEGDDCFGKYPDFWGFWRSDGSGGWTWSSVGAGSTLVRDGDIQGWSWGRGQDGTTHPQPPTTRYEEVCTQALPPQGSEKPDRQSASEQSASEQRKASDRAEETQGGNNEAGSDATTSAASEQRKASGRAEEPPQKSDVPKERLTPRTATTPDRSPGEVAPTAAQEDPAQGPPRTALIAIALIAALGAAGAVAMRRRRV